MDNNPIDEENIIRGTDIIPEHIIRNDGPYNVFIGNVFIPNNKIKYHISNKPVSLPNTDPFDNRFIPGPVDYFEIHNITNDENGIVNDYKIELTTKDIIDLVETVKKQQEQIKELLDFKQEALACICEYNARMSWNNNLNKMSDKNDKE